MPQTNEWAALIVGGLPGFRGWTFAKSWRMQFWHRPMDLEMMGFRTAMATEGNCFGGQATLQHFSYSNPEV
jgi:hypothetical protein